MIWRVVLSSWLWLLCACGPPELPAFARPPALDAGADSGDDDAG